MLSKDEHQRRRDFLLRKLHPLTTELNRALREAKEQNIPVFVRVHASNEQTRQIIVETSLVALPPDDAQTHPQIE